MNNIYELIDIATQKYGNHTLFSYENDAGLTYNQFNKELNDAYRFCLENFEHRTFNFSIIAPNCPNYLYLLFSLLRHSCTAVNLNPNLSTNELKDRLSMAKVSVLFTTPTIYNTLKYNHDTIHIEDVFLFDENALNFKILDNIVFNKNKTPFKNNAETAFLQFTGGTTGIIKAATITHKNVMANIHQLSLHFEKYNKLKSYSLLISFPFYHIFSVVFNFLFFLSIGSTFVLYKNLRDFSYIIDAIHLNNITFIVGVNTWYNKLMQHEKFTALKSNQIELCFAGGEYVPLATKHKWKKLTEKELYSAYGLTETCSLSIISPLDETNIDDAIGEAIPETEAVLLDDNNIEIKAINIQGEIALKGKHITNAYFNNTEETQNAFQNAYFKTGDIAVKINERIFKIVDRKKDMISVSGNKVYPNEIEELICTLDGVIDVAVVGKKSEQTSEQVVAFLVLDLTKISIAQIKSFCRQHFTGFKVPKEYILLDELPKTPIGKTNRKELRNNINLQV